MKTLDKIIEELENWHKARSVINDGREQHKKLIMDTLPNTIEHLKAYQFSLGSDNTKTIDMSHICEVAHELTRVECDKLGIVCDEMDDDGETSYTPESQPVFDKYYDLITNTLNF